MRVLNPTVTMVAVQPADVSPLLKEIRSVSLEAAEVQELDALAVVNAAATKGVYNWIYQNHTLACAMVRRTRVLIQRVNGGYLVYRGSERIKFA